MLLNRNRKVMRSAVFVVVGCLALGACGTEEGGGGGSAESGEAYFDGQDIEMTVPFSTGGGNDAIARYLMPKLEEHLEGNPSISIVNEEGGGSVTGANNFVNRKEPDGTNILSTSTSTMMPWFLGLDAVQYDFAQLQPVAGFPASRILYVNPDLGLESAADLAEDRDEPIVLGGRGATEQDAIALVMFEALGVRDNIEYVFGYPGSGDQFLAYQRGEVDGNSYPTTTYYEGADDLAEQGEVQPLMTFGIPDGEGGFERDPLFPDLPTAAEVYEEIHGSEPSGDAWEAFAMFINLNGAFNYGHWVHADAPEEAVETLRQGYVDMMTDEVLAEGEAVWGPYPPVLGEDLEPVTEMFQSIDEEALDWVREFLRTEYDADL